MLIGSMMSKTLYAPPAPAKPLPTVYYKSDGTGRDSYIVATSGGFHPSTTGKRYDLQFKSSLRAPSADRVSVEF